MLARISARASAARVSTGGGGGAASESKDDSSKQDKKGKKGKKEKKPEEEVVFLPKEYIKDAGVSHRIDVSQPLDASEVYLAPVSSVLPKLQMLQLQEDIKPKGPGSHVADAPPTEIPAITLKPHGLPRMTRIPLQILTMTHLQELRIRRNGISEVPDAISKLQKLRVVDMGENCLTAFPLPLCRCSILEDLDLSENAIPTIPEVLEVVLL